MKDKIWDLQPAKTVRPCAWISMPDDDSDDPPERLVLCASVEMAEAAMAAVQPHMRDGRLEAEEAMCEDDGEIVRSELQAIRDLCAILSERKAGGWSQEPQPLLDGLPEEALDGRARVRMALSAALRVQHMKAWEAMEREGIEFSVETEKLSLDPEPDFEFTARELAQDSTDLPLRKGKRIRRIGLKGEAGELASLLKRLG